MAETCYRKTLEFQFVLGSPVLSLYIFGLSWDVQATLVQDRREGKKIENRFRGQETKGKGYLLNAHKES